MKKKQISSQFYLQSLVPASPVLWHMGQLFPLIRTWEYHTYFSQEVQSEHFVCALSVSPVLAAVKQQQTGEVFSSTLKAAASQSPNKAANQTALQPFFFLFLPSIGSFTRMRGENLLQKKSSKEVLPLLTQTQLSPYLHWHSLHHSSFTSEPILP